MEIMKKLLLKIPKSYAIYKNPHLTSQSRTYAVHLSQGSIAGAKRSCVHRSMRSKSLKMTIAHYRIATLCVCFLTLLQATQHSWGANETLICPQEISPKAIQIAAPSIEWRSLVARPLALTSAGFMQGAPESQADLKPTKSKRNQNTETLTWTFAGEYPQGKWLSCEYNNGALSLSRELTNSFSECSVTYQKITNTHRVVKEIICR